GAPDVQMQAGATGREELLREEEVLRLAEDARGRMRGFGNHEGMGHGAAQARLQERAAADAMTNERDNAQQPALFAYPANAGAATDMKKAVQQELRRNPVGLAKEQQRELFFMELEATKRKAEPEQQLAQRQMLAGDIGAANQLKPLAPGIR